MSGTIVGMAAFFTAYFWLLRNPRSPVTVMPLTRIDELIPFQPEALVLYVSLWIYLSLAVALLRTGRELASHAIAAVNLSVVGLGIFLLWPTAVPARVSDWSDHPGWSFLHEIDAAGNACPSLHVAFAVLAAAWFHRVLRAMGAGRGAFLFNGTWCLAIIYSTLATRQHVFIDVAAGAMLGAAAAGLHWRALRRLDARADTDASAI